jgi:hypothetical protein
VCLVGSKSLKTEQKNKKQENKKVKIKKHRQDKSNCHCRLQSKMKKLCYGNIRWDF